MAPLTPKQARFVAEYLVDLNATRAAIRAGYSEKTAHSAGPRLLEDVDVRAAIDAKSQKVAAKLDISVERIEAELARYAFIPPPGADIEGTIDCEPKDRLKALELLGKRHKMFTDRVEHSLGDLTDEQLEKRKREILAAYQPAELTTRPLE